jgi:DNA gyrase inhibitor GyrI
MPFSRSSRTASAALRRVPSQQVRTGGASIASSCLVSRTLYASQHHRSTTHDRCLFSARRALRRFGFQLLAANRLPMACNQQPARNPRFGISHDDPSVTAPDKCRYDACVELPEGFVGTGKHLTTIIPGGKYAVSRFKGGVAEIGQAWATLLREWLPASGDSRPPFEYYSRESTYDPRTGVFDCDLSVR